MRSLPLVIALASLLGAGCHDQNKEALAIKAAQGKYETWLRSRVPFLTNITPSILYSYEFTVLKEPSGVRPDITYCLKAGDAHALILLNFVIDTDSERAPVGLARNRGSFVRLPALNAGDLGRRRNQYLAHLLYPNELESVVQRVARGDSLQDLRTEADGGSRVEEGFSRARDTDDWEKLSKK